MEKKSDKKQEKSKKDVEGDVVTEESRTEKEEPCCQEEKSFKMQFLRLNADFQNYKKRKEKEKQEWFFVAREQVMNRLLPVLDEFKRAVQICENNDECKNQEWLKGFQLVNKNLDKELLILKIEKVDTSGSFNPDEHEALMQVESKEKQSGKIVQELAAGYKLDGRVIKHAKVSVAK
jgi:molecular chaperone GrpE